MKTLALLCVLVGATVSSAPAAAADPIDIGSRRELFVDDLMVGSLTGDVERKLHRPEPREVVLVTGEPWEGNTCAYYSIFQDGDLYRMYYRGSHWNEQTRKATHPEVTCYAESRDGIHWSKPNLGLVEYEGSTDNNIILDGLGTHCFVAFKDENPDCPPEARYKGVSRGRPVGKKGLYVFQSADAIHWSLIKNEPVITNGVRNITTCTSSDFVNWTKPELLKFPGAPNQHLYTNAIRRYPRAPHLLVGFPTRFLPENEQVEPIFMSSRDGVTFDRWNEAVIPQTAPEDRDGNRSNYMTNGLLALPENDREYSVYATEAYYAGPDSRLRRFTYRLDGFVSLHAGTKGGRMITKPLVYLGAQLSLNFKTGEGGSFRVSLLDEQDKVLGATGLLQGDEIDTVASLSNDALMQNRGKPVRLQFDLKNADMYSFQLAK